jgi:hypothetical protein
MDNMTFIDEVMGFDPAAAVTAFENTTTEKRVNPNIYKTNPANSVSEDGHYHSRVRVLLNPYNIKRNIVHQARYSMRDQNGFFQAISSLSDGDRNCPIFKAWKQLWFANMQDPSDPTKRIPDETKKAWAKSKFDKSESDWVLVQIIEDENQPDLVGMFKVMKLPKAILNRLLAKMSPTDPKKQKQPLMDYLFGAVLEMDVEPGPDDPTHPERKQREISYDLCDFDTDPCPIIKTDGTPLFTDEEIEMIEDYHNANVDLVKAKTTSKRAEAESRKTELAPQIRPLYGKAVEYIKTYAIDPVAECGYTPWDDNLTERVNAWIEQTLKMEDAVDTAAPAAPAENKEQSVAPEKKEYANTEAFTAPASVIDNDDLPF